MHIWTISIVLLYFIYNTDQSHVVHTDQAKWEELFKDNRTSDRPIFCYLQPKTGRCYAHMPRYYYDVNYCACRKFIYGGCGGNHNKFEDKKKCEKKCDVKKCGNEC